MGRTRSSSPGRPWSTATRTAGNEALRRAGRRRPVHDSVLAALRGVGRVPRSGNGGCSTASYRHLGRHRRAVQGARLPEGIREEQARQVRPQALPEGIREEQARQVRPQEALPSRLGQIGVEHADASGRARRSKHSNHSSRQGRRSSDLRASAGGRTDEARKLVWTASGRRSACVRRFAVKRRSRSKRSRPLARIPGRWTPRSDHYLHPGKPGGTRGREKHRSSMLPAGRIRQSRCDHRCAASDYAVMNARSDSQAGIITIRRPLRRRFRIPSRYGADLQHVPR